MAIYLFSQILKFTSYSIKLIENLSRRHLINSSDVFFIKGFTVYKSKFKAYSWETLTDVNKVQSQPTDQKKRKRKSPTLAFMDKYMC